MIVQPNSFRYDTSGNWYKGNTHIHSSVSDGTKEHREIAALYANANYDFLFSTDHWIASNFSDAYPASPLAWFNGIELDGHDENGVMYHIVCLGAIEGIFLEMGLLQALELTQDQDSIQILAHPAWSGNKLEDVHFWDFHGVELYNHYCQEEKGKGDGLPYWKVMLADNPNTLGFCVDDSHFFPDQPQWNGGWIVVNAQDCTETTILKAIRTGNYYSSRGPSFYSINFDGTELNIKTSPVQFIRFVGPSSLCQQIGPFHDDRPLDQSFEIPNDWDYIFVEIEDNVGHRVWTNTLFI